jgi:spore maturation protein A
MLNYIWAGLIISSFVFALGADARDLATDRYRNGRALPVQLAFPAGADSGARSVPVVIRIDRARYAEFYGVQAQPADSYPGTLRRTQEGAQLRFAAGAAYPEPLASIAKVSKSRDDELQGRLVDGTGVVFQPVYFVKLNAIAAAALDFAKTAAEIALGMIALNMAANMFGLGNAATPFGIKAMEELQKLNPSKDTATNSMVMLLAINTASMQLVPPVLLLALLGLQINQLIFPIILASLCSVVIAISAAKLYGRLPGYRASDPNRLPPS